MPSGLKLWPIMTSTAIVLSNDSPIFVKWAALLAKAVFGDRIQICDGTNDNVEIQAAIDALPSITMPPGGTQKVGKVTLSEGNYSIGAGIAIVEDGVILQGMGWHATFLKQADGVNLTYLIWVNNALNCCLRDFFVDGNKANNPGVATDGVVIYGFDISIENMFVEFCKGDGIWTKTGTYGCFFKMVFVEYNNGQGWRIEGTNGSYFIDCVSCDDVGNGFYFDGSYDNALFACHAAIDNEHGFVVFNGSDRNRFIDCAVWEPAKHGWWIHSSHENKIDGCLVRNPSQVTNDTYDGIYLSDASTHNVIVHNVFRGVNANKHRYCINEDSTTEDYNIIKDNELRDAVTAQLRVQGIHTKAYDRYTDLLMDVLAISATHVRTNEDLSAGIPITFTIDAQPDVPRTLSGHFDSHAQITAYSITITGVDAKGNTVSEIKTEADGWDWETSNAFATITSIIMTARTGTGAGDTMDIGITDVLGLSNDIYATGDVYKIKKNNANAVVAGAQVNPTYDTYDMAVIGLAGGDDFTLYYRSPLNMMS